MACVVCVFGVGGMGRGGGARFVVSLLLLVCTKACKELLAELCAS